MENNRKACYSCKFYKPYFICANIHFEKLDYGLCVRKGEKTQIDDKHQICEHFSGLYCYPRFTSKIAMKKLAEAADSINIIMQLFKDISERGS